MHLDVKRLLDSEFLEFKRLYNENTSELSNTWVAMYHHCKITVKLNLDTQNYTIMFSGSIHKMWNSLHGVNAPNHDTNNIKGYNGNQFNLTGIIEIREHLQKLFSCNADQILFQNIEIGINTQPTFNPQKFITGLLYHNGVMFSSKFNRAYAEVIHTNLRVKIYNKGLQYSMNEPTLRIEIHIKKMIELADTGIRTFADVNEHTLNKCFKHLLRRFDEIMYYDRTITTKQLTSKEKQLIANYKNKSYWIDDLLPQHRDRQKKKLKEFIKNNSNNLKAELRQDLINKCVIINSSNIELNITQQPTEETQNITPILPLSKSNNSVNNIILNH